MDFTCYELIRTWEDPDQCGFKLELFDTFQTDDYHKSVLAYRFHQKAKHFKDKWELIFEGADFHCSPMHSIDGDQCVASLLYFLSLRPGDTDAEYFANYTRHQMEWCKEHGESLSLYAHLLEEGEPA